MRDFVVFVDERAPPIDIFPFRRFFTRELIQNPRLLQSQKGVNPRLLRLMAKRRRQRGNFLVLSACDLFEQKRRKEEKKRRKKRKERGN